MEEFKWPEITEDTPIEEVKRIHKKIWSCVIKYGEKPITPYLNNCAACEYQRRHYGLNNCKTCPIDWPKGYICAHRKSLYNKWFRANILITRKYLANVIRNVPWKFEKEGE